MGSKVWQCSWIVSFLNSFYRKVINKDLILLAWGKSWSRIAKLYYFKSSGFWLLSFIYINSF